ncbi:hypothetical protein PROFUN_04615 [Planoprotostelium fungivorum]|uniref:Uncharacterized protein n=1 Tax=Planoprotostelium fungivorum TaxID=1890364 RepID=A0A2P6NUQ0_9EUKA|nr:hypothetical protein PROFUN_04615 [Planoprotostelium fungivorum]
MWKQFVLRFPPRHPSTTTPTTDVTPRVKTLRITEGSTVTGRPSREGSTTGYAQAHIQTISFIEVLPSMIARLPAFEFRSRQHLVAHNVLAHLFASVTDAI